MAKGANVAEETVEVAVPAEVVNELENNSFKDVVNSILKNGGKKSTVTVKNCTWGGENAPYRISLTVRETVKGFVRDNEGNGEVKDTNLVFISLFAISAALKEMPSYAWLGNVITNKPKVAEILLSNAKIDILQTIETEGTEYVNPFSANKEPQAPFQHDTVITHPIRIELSREAQSLATNFAMQSMML